MAQSTESTQSRARSGKFSKGGRPSKKTEETIRKLEEAFRDDATIKQACYIAGISTETYYDWLRNDEIFSDKMGKAQEYLKVISKRVLTKAVEEGDKKIALEVIKRREKDRYSERSELTGKDGQDIELTWKKED